MMIDARERSSHVRLRATRRNRTGTRPHICGAQEQRGTSGDVVRRGASAPRQWDRRIRARCEPRCRVDRSPRRRRAKAPV